MKLPDTTKKCHGKWTRLRTPQVMGKSVRRTRQEES